MLSTLWAYSLGPILSDCAPVRPMGRHGCALVPGRAGGPVGLRGHPVGTLCLGGQVGMALWGAEPHSEAVL